MQLFYLPTISDSQVVLNDIESKHAVRVLRLVEGDKVQVIDGKGGFYKCEITVANPRKCQLRVTKTIQNFGRKDFKLHIAIAPTKNIDRFEWFLEKCTEIGIDEITPILTEHSERKIIKPERLERILVSAMKQSVKAYLPKLNKLTTFKNFIEQRYASEKYIAHCNIGNKNHLKNEISKGSNALLLIGPEGDFSPKEVEQAQQHNFQEISLGKSRLRTETAGVVGCHIVNLLNE